MKKLLYIISSVLIISLLSILIIYLFNNNFLLRNEPDFENLNNLTDIFTPVDTIYLEADYDNLISNIFQLQNWNNKWCIPQTSEILIFDSDGKFITKLGKKGNGPGEFDYIKHIIPGNNGELLVYDAHLYRITIFDSLFNYKNSFKIENIGTVEMFVKDRKNNYYFYNRNLFEDKYTIKIFDEKFNYKKSFINFPYSSVIQVYLAANVNLSYAKDINSILVTHIYSPNLKIVSLDNLNEIKNMPLDFKYWEEIDEDEIHSIFPKISTNPEKLYKYLFDKVRLWRIYYLKNGLLLINYWFEGKWSLLQIFDINTGKSLIFNKPSNMVLSKSIGIDVYFTEINYQKSSEVRNPRIFKFRLNEDIIKSKLNK